MNVEISKKSYKVISSLWWVEAFSFYLNRRQYTSANSHHLKCLISDIFKALFLFFCFFFFHYSLRALVYYNVPMGRQRTWFRNFATAVGKFTPAVWVSNV